MSRSQYTEESFIHHAGPLGYLEGLRISSQQGQPLVQYFGGVPYALPPINRYRFRRPRRLPEFYSYGTKVNPGRFTRKAAYCPQPQYLLRILSDTFEEDCLQLNIYIPEGRQRPEKGWPVFFYIHGGFLQWGSPNIEPSAATPLMSETALHAIIVTPGYRLNLFGFLASKELHAEAEKDGESAGNMGFWDQRAALEWTAKNIRFFGGDANNITVGGYSAGSHSAFHQLAHELYFVPDDKAVIKRAIMWSNSPGVQPRTASEHQAQFEELLTALNIPLSLSAEEKLKKLRDTPIEDLVSVQATLKISEFRATSDDAFVSKTLMTSIDKGDFARRMKRRNIKLMNGECRDEHNLYQSWRTPSQSYHAVRTRLIGDYPETVVNKLMHYYCGEARALPPGVEDWQDLFGRIYADIQVHHLERGFHRALEAGGLRFGQDVLRYRINWRAKCMDDVFPPEWNWGVTHSTDMAIWFWGLDYGAGLLDDEKKLLEPWNKAFASFVHGDDPVWGTKNARDIKRLRSDGKTDVWVDDQWEEGLKVWNLVNGSGSGLVGWIKAKLS